MFLQLVAAVQVCILLSHQSCSAFGFQTGIHQYLPPHLNSRPRKFVGDRSRSGSSTLLAAHISPDTSSTSCTDFFSPANEHKITTILLSASLATFVALHATAFPVNAFDESDYASSTVTSAVKTLDDAGGNREKSFAAFEEIGKIITEGKGIGGSLSYGGVQLERGLVADEDTAIYNPGLSLLTESEKERLVDAIVRNKKTGLAESQWSDDNQYGFDFLKEKLDPLHMFELRSYLAIVPIYGAVLYLGALFVQQNARGLFPVAYIFAAILMFGPVAAFIALGP